MRNDCLSMKHTLSFAGALVSLGVALPAAAETVHAKLTG